MRHRCLSKNELDIQEGLVILRNKREDVISEGKEIQEGPVMLDNHWTGLDSHWTGLDWSGSYQLRIVGKIRILRVQNILQKYDRILDLLMRIGPRSVLSLKRSVSHSIIILQKQS